MAKIGDALKRAVEIEAPSKDDPVKRKRTPSVLMNSNRLYIFKLLCYRPCVTVGFIASRLSISRATVTWHLERLIEAGYVVSHDLLDKGRYHPKGMLKQDETLIVLTLLNDRRCGPLFRLVMLNPGIDRNGLRELFAKKGSIKSCIDQLEEHGMITSIQDGRHVRYYPTSKIQEMMKAAGSRMKAFQSQLIKRMQTENLKPEIKEMKGKGLVIHLQLYKHTEAIEIPYHPIETSLAE